MNIDLYTRKKIYRSSIIGMICCAISAGFAVFGITYSVMSVKVKQAYIDGANQEMKETFEALANHRTLINKK